MGAFNINITGVGGHGCERSAKPGEVVVMEGRRLPDGFECTTPELSALGLSTTPPGAYWKDSNGQWAVCTPNGRIGSVAKHGVVEHEDGTITVSPSILVYAIEGRDVPEGERAMLVDAGYALDANGRRPGRPGWHGYLERGIWREV